MSAGTFRCDAEALARVRAAFQDNFSRGAETGAAVSVWHRGREVLHMEGGSADRGGRVPWRHETPVLVWSATKGPSSACVLHALHEASVSLDQPVADIWPEFSASGKSTITLRQALSHAAGLAALTSRSVDALDHEAVARAVEAMAPAWEPGRAHGYSPRVFGTILEEICRRVAGIPLGEYWNTRFAAPHGIDFWIGLPESKSEGVAEMIAPRAVASHGEKTAFERAFTEPGSLTQAAFSTPSANFLPAAMNRPDMRAAMLPAMGGIGSAAGLAKFYALAADPTGPFGEAVLAATRHADSQGHDLVLQLETAFAGGFMLDPVHSGKKLRAIFGPAPGAFGHPGAGGSLAFADPENGMAFAYVMNLMEYGALPRQRTLRLVQALYGV